MLNWRAVIPLHNTGFSTDDIENDVDLNDVTVNPQHVYSGPYGYLSPVQQKAFAKADDMIRFYKAVTAAFSKDEAALFPKGVSYKAVMEGLIAGRFTPHPVQPESPIFSHRYFHYTSTVTGFKSPQDMKEIQQQAASGRQLL